MLAKFSSMEDALKDTKKDFDKLKEDKNLWDEVGKTVVQNMRAAQASGKGSTSHDGSYQKFSPLKESTIKSRERTEKAGQMSSLTEPNRSNLIETGKLHEDLTHIASSDSVEITHKSQESKEVAFYLDERGDKNFKFMYLGKVNTKAVKNIILKYLDKIIKGA